MNTTSYISANIDGLHNRWVQALEDLKHITHKLSKQDHLAYMQELVDEANTLHQQYSDHIHPIQSGKLLHIVKGGRYFVRPQS